MTTVSTATLSAARDLAVQSPPPLPQFWHHGLPLQREEIPSGFEVRSSRLDSSVRIRRPLLAVEITADEVIATYGPIWVGRWRQLGSGRCPSGPVTARRPVEWVLLPSVEFRYARPAGRDLRAEAACADPTCGRPARPATYTDYV